MATKKSINISIDELKKNKGQMFEDSRIYKFFIKDKRKSVTVPQGTLFKMNEIIAKHTACDVGYLPKHRLWYIILGEKILWSNFPINNKSSPKPNSSKKSKSIKFNRYTALLGRQEHE